MALNGLLVLLDLLVMELSLVDLVVLQAIQLLPLLQREIIKRKVPISSSRGDRSNVLQIKLENRKKLITGLLIPPPPGAAHQ